MSKRRLTLALLLGLVKGVTEKNAKQSQAPFGDPYTSPDEFLAKLFGKQQDTDSPRRKAVESYSLFPMVMLAVRRNLRQHLNELWQPITDVALTWFRPDAPEDSLLWHSDKGKEYSQAFARPQSWKELQELASRDDRDRVPKALQDDPGFALLFSLVFQHRTQLSLIKHLDDLLSAPMPS